MKTIILFILCTFAISYVSAQAKQDIINGIEKKYQAINQETHYETVTLENEEFLERAFIRSDYMGYGKLTGYFKNGIIYKITEAIGLKKLFEEASTEYYFSGENLILVYENEDFTHMVFIDSTGSIDPTDIPRYTFECRYYFENGKLIETKPLGEKKTMLLPDEKYFDSQSKEGQLLTSAGDYIKLLKEKLVK